ncbi:outer membrane protein transport protein [uncultured Cloacibacillus sp.]|uniref:OmpP1/FadL family transporter n=1 Tax=uncultured Cloacibacillus sp. TaxID=889794 RepID=UPI0025F84787|nr:outer membrane protein transport protein [uncultured Cloacibacillus sp.]
MVNVRRKLLALLSAAALTACASSAAFAEGFGVYEWSAAGTAMGEAYMFGEEDPSVLAYNPAQITKLDGTYFSIGASLVNPDTKVLFRGLGALNNFGPDQTWENEYDPAVIPYMYYATKAGKNSWWGIAMFSRFGNQIEYDDLWPGRYDTIFSGIKGFTVQPTYAFKIGNKLSAAVGLDINYVKLRMRKSVPLMNLGMPNVGTDLEGDTVNVGWLASLMYDFDDKTSLAVTYRSRIKHTMDDADIAFSANGFNVSSGASGTVTLPDSIAIGLGHKFDDRTRVELNAVWTNWETYNALNIYFDNPALGIPPVYGRSLNEKNWEACWRYGIGIEHKLSKQWSILAGYVFDESPIPDSTMDFTVPTGDRHRGSIGFKYRFKENHEIVFAYTGIWADSRETQSRLASNGSPDYQSSEIFDGFTQVISLGYTIKLK